ncbi:hypothetical protein I79_019809 [Cricetulus griseus]|uniref:Uncharacterized protein n=1 Tax=Cricetulus griseus TaxID=10029 RepID=G3I8E5_CRIGR|nr:hypothetical protein I79_019809 [Cricetulus griseus]
MVSNITGKECCECFSDTGKLQGVMCAALATTKLTMIAHKSYVGGGGFLQEEGWVIKPQRFADIFARHDFWSFRKLFRVSINKVFPSCITASHYCLFHLSDGFLVCGKDNHSFTTNLQGQLLDCNNEQRKLIPGN